MELHEFTVDFYLNIHLRIIKKTGLFLFLLFLCPIFFDAQTNKDFEILRDKAFQKLYENPEDCIRYTQSLLLSEKEKDNQIILQKIISQAYTLEGNYVQSISLYNQKEDGNKSEFESADYFVQLFDNYNLADIYQNLQLYGQSQNIISVVLSDEKLLKTSDPKMRSVIAKLYQLQAINAAISKNYQLANKSLKQSDQYLNINSKEARFLRRENVIFFSSFLLRLNKPDEAKQILEKTIAEIETQDKSPFFLAYAYQNLSKCYFQKQNYVVATEKLKIGFSKIEHLSFNGMKLVFYDLFSKNYLALKNDERYVYYNHLYESSKKTLETNRKEGIQYSIKLLENQQKENYIYKEQLQKKPVRTLIQIFIFLIFGLLIFWFYQFKVSKNLKKQILFFQRLEQQDIVAQKEIRTTNDEDLEEENKEKEITNSSKERDHKILKNIEEWEKTYSFLNKNMSLAVFSQQTGINKQYLSEFINTNKEKNFNAYINELRINHIAHLLRNDPSYLNYKVSYLAEYSGFSSHGAFSNVFKSITGMSPNTYIQQIVKSKSQ